MARGGKSSRGQRDASSPSLAQLLAPPKFVPAPVPLHRFTSLEDIEDGRRYTPSSVTQPMRTDGTPHRSLRAVRARADGSSAKRRKSQLSGIPRLVGFEAPENVIRCVRRKQRREVIFAKKRYRKGAGARRRRRNFWSNVSC